MVAEISVDERYFNAFAGNILHLGKLPQDQPMLFFQHIPRPHNRPLGGRIGQRRLRKVDIGNSQAGWGCPKRAAPFLLSLSLEAGQPAEFMQGAPGSWNPQAMPRESLPPFAGDRHVLCALGMTLRGWGTIPACGSFPSPPSGMCAQGLSGRSCLLASARWTGSRRRVQAGQRRGTSRIVTIIRIKSKATPALV